MSILQNYSADELRRMALLKHQEEEGRRQRAIAPAPEGFTLAGSNRPADIAASHGQEELFK